MPEKCGQKDRERENGISNMTRFVNGTEKKKNQGKKKEIKRKEMLKFKKNTVKLIESRKEREKMAT